MNQSEVNSFDQQLWRQQRKELYSRLASSCKNNGLTFTNQINDQLIIDSTTEKIVFAMLFDLIEPYQQWQKFNETCKKFNKVVFVITDNILKFKDLEFIKFFSYPELLGVTASYNLQRPTASPSKLYNCFIQRVEGTRQSWFYFLYEQNLLDKGWVSFLLYQLNEYSNNSGQDLFTEIHYKYNLDQLPHFDRAYHALKNQVPFQNFQEQDNLLPIIIDSKYSLILETYATDDNKDQWCITEKLLRALQFPNYILPFCQKGTIFELKSLGLMFNLNLDHIDNLPWIERQQQLLKFLTNDPVDFDIDLLYYISSHNQKLLKSWQQKYQAPDFFENFFNKAILF